MALTFDGLIKAFALQADGAIEKLKFEIQVDESQAKELEQMLEANRKSIERRKNDIMTLEITKAELKSRFINVDWSKP